MPGEWSSPSVVRGLFVGIKRRMMVRPRCTALIGSLALAALASCNGNGGANGEDRFRSYTATLSGDQEVPPVDTEATGTGSFTLDVDARVMVVAVSFSGLSGPITAAHFHVAPPGASGGVIIDLTEDFAGDDDGFVQGAVTFTAAQIADLDAGNVYINLHTETNPDGEIRGQLTLAP